MIGQYEDILIFNLKIKLIYLIDVRLHAAVEELIS